LSAAAHQLDDEPPDPAEEPMTEDAFAVIQRAHAICDHPPAQDEGVHQCTPSMTTAALEQHAIKILGAMIFAGKLVAEMKQRGDFDLNVSDLVETDSEGSHWYEPSRLNLVDDETDEVVTDWESVAQDAWRSQGWAQAAQEYQFARLRR
jgi:hypothetical protein